MLKLTTCILKTRRIFSVDFCKTDTQKIYPKLKYFIKTRAIRKFLLCIQCSNQQQEAYHKILFNAVENVAMCVCFAMLEF